MYHGLIAITCDLLEIAKCRLMKETNNGQAS